MKLKIIHVEQKEYEEIETNEPMKYYRRISPDYWEHYLGDLHGWHRLMDCLLYEEAYYFWAKNNANTKHNK